MAKAAAAKLDISNARIGSNPLAFYFAFEAPTNSARVEQRVLYATGNSNAAIVENVLVVTGECTAEIKENVIFVN